MRFPFYFIPLYLNIPYLCKMKQGKIFIIIAIILLIGCQHKTSQNSISEKAISEGFVYLNNDKFMILGEEWFPMMLNYRLDWRKFDDTTCVSPAYYYGYDMGWDANNVKNTREQLRENFAQISGWGFNALRLCIDVVNHDSLGYFYAPKKEASYLINDSSAIFANLDWVADCAEQCGMKIMFLLKAPFDDELKTYTNALMSHFANNPTIWAYDFMNEPLYFDPVKNRDKMEACEVATEWHQMRVAHAPNQLMTIGFSEPIEVFSWDPAMIPVDFVQIHTYSPLRVASEMYWYGKYIKKPWMIGETGLPCDGDSIPYEWQSIMMKETYQCAIDNGAIGYGWWEYQDCIVGDFEGLHTGLISRNGEEKPACKMVKELKATKQSAHRPVNYYNMVGYNNIMVMGKVVDEMNRPIEGAVVRAWNEDWSIGQHTFSDSLGKFTLYSNDYCKHFKVSAPHYSMVEVHPQITYKPTIETPLPNQKLEYQQIPYQDFRVSDKSLLNLKHDRFKHYQTKGSMETIKLRKL